MKKKLFSIVSVLLLATTTITGCQNDSTTTAEVDPNAQVIQVGTGNMYRPFCYLDENNQLQGYDYEVLKAMDEALPEYSFSIEPYDFQVLLTSLDSGNVQMAGHQFEANEEREAKYLYGTVSYTDYTTYIASDASSDTTYETLDDLVGKKVYTLTGSNSAYLLEEYNKEHTPGIEIEYANGGSDELLVSSITSGKTDATVLTKYDIDKINKAYNDVLKSSNESVSTSQTYFIFSKGNEELQQKVDEALQGLKESGKLSEISTEYLGGDYTE